MNPEPIPVYHVPVDRHPPYPALGRPRNTERRISIMQRHNAKAEPRYVAQVREPNGKRVYIGRYEDEQEARTDAQTFIDTGAKPKPKKAGAKKGQRQQKPRWTAPRVPYSDTIAKPLPTAERLARQWAKEPRRSPVEVPPASEAIQSPRINGKGVEKAKVALRVNIAPVDAKAARLAMIKRAWRATA